MIHGKTSTKRKKKEKQKKNKKGSQKDQAQIFCYQKQYRHSLRTVGDSLKEYCRNITPSILLTCYHLFFSTYKMVIYLLSVMLSVRPMFAWYWREFHIVVKLVFNPIVYI